MVATRRDELRDSHNVGAAIRALGAEGYERSWIQRQIARIHDAMLASVAAEAGAPDSILDVGCGTGRLLRRVGQRWPDSKLTGIDPTAEMISVARRLAPEASFHVASAEALPLADSSVALAFSSISLHHWNDPLQGLREIARTLHPGGCLVLADITLPPWLARLLRSGAQSPAGIRRLVNEAGLELQALRLVLARVILVAVAVKPGRAAS